MWLEAILSRDDLERVAVGLAPLTLAVGAHADVRLEAPTSVTLVDELGLRLVCPASLRGRFLGVDIPISIHSATLLVVPSIVNHQGSEVVLFTASVEGLEVAALPRLVERLVVDGINAALCAPGAELRWNFRETLSHSFGLPVRLFERPVLTLVAKWGKIRVTPTAIVFAVSFSDEGGDSVPARAPDPGPSQELAAPVATPSR